mgnify:CR=1 FL=1
MRQSATVNSLKNCSLILILGSFGRHLGDQNAALVDQQSAMLLRVQRKLKDALTQVELVRENERAARTVRFASFEVCTTVV